MTLHIDGNAAAGMFAEALGIDITTATLTCATCGNDAPFAESHLYDHAPGMIARCNTCESVLARLVRTPTAAWLDLRGARSVRIPLNPAAG